MNLKLMGGNIITMDPVVPRATAIAVRDGRVVAVGGDEEVKALDLGACEVLHLRGATVVPGFVDSHAHVFPTGLTRFAVDLHGCTSVAEVCGMVGRRAEDASPGDWVFGFGCNPWSLIERRYPTLSELDAAAPRNAAYVISGTLHSGATNRRGLRALAQAERLPSAHSTEPEERGWFLDDTSHFPVMRFAVDTLDDAMVRKVIDGVLESAASRGVTTLHCLEGGIMESDRDVTTLLARSESLPVRAVVMYQTMDVERVVELGLQRIGGCLTVDGACFEHTAYFYEPYLDQPDTCGTLNYSEEEVRAFVFEAQSAGLQIGMHAIGDHAIDILVRAYADAASAFPRPDLRHRVEHFHAPSEAAIRIAKELHLALPMQPIFSYLWDRPEADHYVESFGPQRAEPMEPFARLIAEGLVVSGGSDSPVTEIHPLLGIHAAVNNPRASRRTAVMDALAMFTRNGAWVAHDEDRYGMLRAGSSADIAVLGGDPCEQPREILDIPVLMTVCRGAVTYDGGDLA